MAAIADFDYYRNEYKGIVITSDVDYSLQAERAGDELAPFLSKIPNTDEGQTALKCCACAIADVLYGDMKSSRNGVKINSESVSGYYSVSYASPSYGMTRIRINNLLAIYLGKWILGSKKVMM